jgi:hypothetical protein
MKLALLVLVVVAAVAAGCGGGSSSSSSTEGSSGTQSESAYPQNVQDQFLRSCAAQAKSVSSLSDARVKSYCGCTLDYIQARVDYDEFKAADRAAATLNKAPKHARAVFLAAIKNCRKSG